VLVRAADEAGAAARTPWPTLAADLEEHTVPGDHFTMLVPPHLTALAAALHEVLR
jgi:thioesterase domain-containing protein